MEKFKYLKIDKINKLPESPGVYAFLKGAKFIYIGKAVNLRDRVKQHRKLLNLATKIGYIKTDSEFADPSAHLTSYPASQGSTIEALILESQLIKKYQPKYNTIWKDDKNYFYVATGNEDFPRIFITHQINYENRSRSIGPFVDGGALKETLMILRKIFPYYTASKHPEKLCPWCHLNLCPGPNPDKKEYKKNIKNLISVLEGKRKSVLNNTKREMQIASKEENFEKAARLRNQIRALENIISHETRFQTEETWFLRKRIEAYDVSNIQGKYATGSMVTFINRRPDKNLYRKFKIKITGKPNDTAMIKEILSRRLKHSEWPLPDAILIDGGKAQFNAAKSVIKNKIRVMALAKKKNELFVEDKKSPVLLKTLPREFFNLILQLRDEAHRFAISYHKKLRAKALLSK